MFTHRIDAWTFCFKSLSLSLSLSSLSLSTNGTPLSPRDPTHCALTTAGHQRRQTHPKSLPHVPGGQKHRCPAPAANSEAHEADDRYFQVSLQRRLMLPTRPRQHLAHVPKRQRCQTSARAPSMLTNSTSSCAKAGSGVDQRHSALA